MTARVEAQVVIIGSGAGGSAAALELASAGLDVLVLEEGSRVEFRDYGASSPRAAELFYRRRGMTPILGPMPVGYIEGCCLGGSTEINSGFWQRPASETLHQWKSSRGLADAGPEELDPHFEFLEKLLSVALPQEPWPASTRVFERGASVLGWAVKAIPRLAPNCQNQNLCASGCPTGAKQSMSRSLLPRAQKAGAKIMTNCRVSSLILERDRVAGAIVRKKTRTGPRKRF
jgi:choline dehydrogenase-like flavoprotein